MANVIYVNGNFVVSMIGEQVLIECFSQVDGRNLGAQMVPISMLEEIQQATKVSQEERFDYLFSLVTKETEEGETEWDCSGCPISYGYYKGNKMVAWKGAARSEDYIKLSNGSILKR